MLMESLRFKCWNVRIWPFTIEATMCMAPFFPLLKHAPSKEEKGFQGPKKWKRKMSSLELEKEGTQKLEI